MHRIPVVRYLVGCFIPQHLVKEHCAGMTLSRHARGLISELGLQEVQIMA
jgi:hypothetical protein